MRPRGSTGTGAGRVARVATDGVVALGRALGTGGGIVVVTGSSGRGASASRAAGAGCTVSISGASGARSAMGVRGVSVMASDGLFDLVDESRHD